MPLNDWNLLIKMMKMSDVSHLLGLRFDLKHF